MVAKCLGAVNVYSHNLPALVLQSPRLMGELSHGVGKLNTGIGKLFNPIFPTLDTSALKPNSRQARKTAEFAEGLSDASKVENLPIVTPHKGGNDIAVAKSIRCNMANNDSNFKWRTDENGNYDYEHFVKDPARAGYLKTLPSTYKKPDTVILGTHNNEPRDYLLKQYYNPQREQKVYDIGIKHNNALINKLVREGRKGAREFEKIMRQSPQVSEAALGQGQTRNTLSPELQAAFIVPQRDVVVNLYNKHLLNE